MQQRGWTYEPVLQRSSLPEPRTVGALREFRETFGYGLFTTGGLHPDQSAVEAADRNYEYYSSLGSNEQASYRNDLDGDTLGEGEPVEGSCEALADEAQRLPLSDQAVMTELRNLYIAGVQSSTYISAVDEWRRCLRLAGFEMEHDGSPELFVESMSVGLPTAEAVALEIDVAVADFECRVSTTMPVVHALETRIVDVLIEKHPAWEH